MRRATRFLPVFVAAALLAGCASSRYDWELLGRKEVSLLGNVDRDSIHVGRSQGRFRELRVVVEGAPVEMYDMEVIFGDGSSFRPETRLFFAPNTESRTINLPGRDRVIRRIDFVYRKSSGLFQRARVSVYGR
jgi:hypothetical protein